MSAFAVSDHLKVLNQFIGKSDGKDKLCATIQYVCLFLSAGRAGNITKIQSSVAAARKVFRILKPLEILTPLLLNPWFNDTRNLLIAAIAKILTTYILISNFFWLILTSTEVLLQLKSVLMAGYFTFDHLVWSGQAGLVTDALTLTKARKTSTYCWLGGSICTLICQCYEIMCLLSIEKGEKSDEEWTKELRRIREEVNRHTIILVHALFQACLAVGLLQLLPIKPRGVGLLGIITSAISCYMIFPPMPKAQEKVVKKD